MTQQRHQPPTTNQYGETYINYHVRFGDNDDPKKTHIIRMKMNSTILEMKHEIIKEFNDYVVNDMDIGSFWDFGEGEYHIYDDTFKFNKIMNKYICVYNQRNYKNDHQIKKFKNSGGNSEICLKEYIKTHGCKCQNCQYNKEEDEDEDDSIDLNTYFIDVEHRKRITNVRVTENETTVEAVF